MRLGIFIATLALVSLNSVPSSAAWKKVKHFVQPSVEVVEETEDTLVLEHSETGRRVVLSRERTEGCHLYGRLVQSRRGNPYRIWVATSDFWNDENFPRSKWGEVFRTEFLRTVRPPRETEVAR